MKPHFNRNRKGLSSLPSVPVPAPPAAVEIASEDQNDDAQKTLDQLNEIVAGYYKNFPEYTQSIPTLREGEEPLIAVVRTLVSSLAKRNEELLKANRESRAAAKAKEEFLANMSHEIRTPMNGIFGMVNLMLEGQIEDEHRDYLDTVRSSTELLLNVLNDVLDFSKLSSQQLELDPREFNVAQLVESVMRTFEVAAKEKGLDLYGEIDKDLPECVIGDDLRLRQILSNLVSNAVKFTAEGEIAIRVYQLPNNRNGSPMIWFEVADSGIGITEETQEKLFQPFAQADTTTTRQFGGTGLGLTISRNLIELMGGRISLTSEVGRGSVFGFKVELRCPKALELTAADTASISPRILENHVTKKASLSDRSERLQVLLVEDNLVNQKVASLTLNRIGCDVKIANNGQEGVEMATGEDHFDLICMDVQMPLMDGLEATRRIRASDHPNSKIKILAMTGLAFSDDREHCLEAGMNEVITKPFEISTLRSAIEDLIGEECEDLVMPA